jgi:hypothetical protein
MFEEFKNDDVAVSLDVSEPSMSDSDVDIFEDFDIN